MLRQSQLQLFFYRNIAVISILGVLLLLIVVFGATTEAFLTPNNFLNLLRQSAPTLIVAVAMSYVITTGGIDLSVGSMVALTSALSAALLSANFPAVLTALAMLGLGLLIGLINGWFSSYQGIPAFIVTLAMLSVIRGGALLQTQGYSIQITNSFFTALGQGRIGFLPIPALIAILVALLGWVGLTQLPYGQYVTGIGSNEEAVRRSGVDTRRIKLSVYLLTGLAAALAGMIVAARLASGSANAGVGFELEVITAVVLGGTNLFGGRGTIVGTILGVLTIAVIGNGLILLRLSPFIVPIVQGSILLFALWVNTRIFSRFGEARKR
ncbi:ABC transporter permease [Phormidium tenue FACHB-886]|nr:ABC transporter permease [Phormidium tenue FACHB-886]